MSRRLLDDGFRTWEVYATAGAFGMPDHARVVFLCLSEPDRRALWTEREGDRQALEAWIEGASDADLAEVMAAAEELR